LLGQKPWAWPVIPVITISPLVSGCPSLMFVIVVVGVLSCVAFTILLFLSSFITTYLISGSGDDSYLYIYPWETFREVIRTAVCILTDQSCDNYAFSSRRPTKLRYPTPRGPPTLLGRFVRRLLLGLPTVGAGSLLNMLWSLPFPITHWLRVRLRRTGRNASDFMSLVLLTVVLIGAAR
jgi:hypothetical protein